MIKSPGCSLALIYISLLFGFAVVAQPQDRIPVKLLKDDFRLLREKLETSQAGLYQYTRKDSFDMIFDNIDRSLDAPMTSREFFAKVSPLNKHIRNVHNLIWASDAYEKDLETGLPRFPLDVHWSDGKMYVLRNNSLSKEIVEGSIIQTINGENAAHIFNFIVENVTRDGFNETYPIARSSKMFSYYYSELIGSPKTFQVEIEAPQGMVQKFDLQGLTATEIRQARLSRYQRKFNQFGEDWELAPKEPALHLEITNGVALLTIRTFSTWLITAGGQDYQKFFDDAFKQIESSNATDVVIDLRNNHGGHDIVAMEIMSHLRTDSFNYYKDRRSLVRVKGKTIKSGGFYKIVGRGPWTGEVAPARPFFGGNVFVLINAFTVSAGGEFAGHLKNTGRAVFVGEETGGNPVSFTGGQSVHVQLPNTLVTAVIPTVYVELNVRFENAGRGVKPDFEVKPSIKDILAGKDVEMDYVKELIADRHR